MADEGRESGGREPADGARDDVREGAREGDESREPRGAPDVTDLADRLAAVRADLDAFEREIEERTVDRPRVEAELKRYVRSRLRQGHARGWGPYLVLLYGTVMTLGAFYWLRASPWAAVAAMLVIFTSTLGLYVLFVLFGGVLGVVGAAGGLLDRLRGGKEG